MGRWTYYAPLWLGVLVILSLNDAIRAALKSYEPAQQWLVVIAAALAGGLHCQALLIGSQGAFAQVLPVPRGKSIRGTPAVVAGWLLIFWFVLSIVTLLLALEQIYAGVLVVGITAAAALLSSLATYAWSLPAAVADFRADRLG